MSGQLTFDVASQTDLNNAFQAAQVERVEYIHLELGGHDVIFAEGAASETFIDDGNRAMFHNTRDDAPPHGALAAASYYARRVESGFELEAIRRQLARSAGSQAA